MLPAKFHMLPANVFENHSIYFLNIQDFSGDPSKLSQLTYNNPNSNDKPAWAHVGGIVAYSNSEKSKNCLYAASHSQSLL